MTTSQAGSPTAAPPIEHRAQHTSVVHQQVSGGCWGHLSNGAIWVGTETGIAEDEAALVAAGARRISRTEPQGSPVPHDGP